MIQKRKLDQRLDFAFEPNFPSVIFFGALATALFFIEHTVVYDIFPYWAWPRAAWLLFAVSTICLISIRALRLLAFVLLIVALSPLSLWFSDNCGFYGCDEDQVFFSKTYTFTDDNGEEVEVEIEGKSRFLYPVEAMALDGEAVVRANLTVVKNGTVSVTGISSSASDLRSAFENAARNYYEGWHAKVMQSQALAFPLTKEVNLPFYFINEDGTDLERDSDGKLLTERFFPLGNIIFNILVVVVVAISLSMNSRNALSAFPFILSSVISFIGIPYGLYLIACNLGFMIASGVTTNYAFLAGTLMSGCSLILLSFLVDRISSKTDLIEIDFSVGRERFFLASILLALGPLLGNSSGVISDVGNWFPASSEDYLFGLLYFWTWFEKTFTFEVLVFSSLLGSCYIFYRFGFLSLEGLYDVALIIAAVGIATGIILWFADMRVIAQDYVYIFSSLGTAAAALFVCSLSFCLFGLIAIQNPPLSLDRARKNLLLTELFAFFLFFAYAPISVSELGQSFEIGAEAAKREENLVDRVKELEEKLGIVFEENEND